MAPGSKFCRRWNCSGQGRRFSLAAVLLIKHQRSRRLVFVKKSYRSGFEGDDQFDFSGAMVRSNELATNLNSMIMIYLAARVAGEVSFDLLVNAAIKPVEG